MPRTTLIDLVAIALGLAACATPDATMARQPSTSTIVPQAQIGVAVAEALCQLEERCGQIDHLSVAECTRQTAYAVADEVDAEDCQDGAIADKLESCLAAIGAQTCSADVDAASLAACDEDVMCIQPAWGAGRAASDGQAAERWDLPE